MPRVLRFIPRSDSGKDHRQMLRHVGFRFIDDYAVGTFYERCWRRRVNATSIVGSGWPTAGQACADRKMNAIIVSAAVPFCFSQFEDQ